MIFGRQKRAEASDKRPLVAVIDDETDLCLLVQTALEGRGYAVATANDGEQGLALIRERHPALVVLDFKMPKLNGYQVLAQMQKDPQLAPTPVIVVTSVDEENKFTEQEWAERLGVPRFFAKPFSPEDIAKAAMDIVPVD